MKKRDKLILGVILFLIFWIIFWNILPVGNGNWNEKQIQRIISTDSSGNFCFAVMGDNKNGFSTFDEIIDSINNKKLLFAINIGDLVYDGDKEKYRIFYNEIQGINSPFLVGVGNHDITENGRVNYFETFGNFYYSFSYNNSLFIILDDANERNISTQQIQFLEDKLKGNFEYKFVFMHVPPFDPRRYISYLGVNQTAEHCLSDKRNAQQFTDLMTKYNVTDVFASHIHGFFNETKDNIPYIITGGAGGEMLQSDSSHYFYHYINFCVNGNNTSYEIVKFHSPGPNTIDRLGHTIWLYVWYFIVTNKYIILAVILTLLFVIDSFYKQIKDFIKKIKKRKS
jgi:serine/threonine-protein phosphatase CPPED1